jgi:hypothetical protein
MTSLITRQPEGEWLSPKMSWGPLPTPRSEHFAFARGSKMYIFGGLCKTEGPNEKHCIYSLNTRKMVWSEEMTTGNPPPLEARRNYHCALFDNKLFCLSPTFAALNDSKVRNIAIYVLDLDTMEWKSYETSGALPPTLDPCIVTVYENVLYVLAWNRLQPYTGSTLSSLRLDTIKFEWMHISHCSNPPYPQTMACLSDSGIWYFTGGRPDDSRPYPSLTIRQYNLKTKSWSDLRLAGVSAPPREGATLSYWNDNLIMFGGVNNFWGHHSTRNLFDDVCIISCVNQTWPVQNSKEIRNKLQARFNHSAVIIDDKLWIFGGMSKNGPLNDTRVFSLVDKGAANEVVVPSTTTLTKKLEVNKNSSVSTDNPPDNNKFPSNFIDRMKIAFNNRDFYADVAFVVKDKIFYAHKIILCSRSIVFKKMFDTKERSQVKKSPGRGANGDEPSASEIELSTREKDNRLSKNTNTSQDSNSSGSGSGSGDEKTLKSKEDDKNKKVTKERIDSGTPISSDTQRRSSSMATPRMNMIEKVTKFEGFDPNAFEKVLYFIYTGEVELTSREEADQISAIAYEFLLDQLMKFCQLTEKFPTKCCEEPIAVATALRKGVGSPIGSDIFFIVKKKKLFAHRILLCVGSDYFYQTLKNEPGRRYFDMSALDERIDLNTFIEYVRLVYSFFYNGSESKIKEVDISQLLELALIYKDQRFLDLFYNPEIYTPENIAKLYLGARQHNLSDLSDSCLCYLMKNFATIVRQTNVLSVWDENFTKDILALYKKDESTWNWLDLLWLAHNCKMSDMKNEAIENLSKLINIENVVPVLVCAHTTGEKKLRSQCLDYLLTHASDVETYQRMQAYSEHVLSSIAGLSVSLSKEISQKVSKQVTSLKTAAKSSGLSKKFCSSCAQAFDYVGTKKHSCTLCKRVVCSNCLAGKEMLPPVFGYMKRKTVCLNCKQLVSLITPPETTNKEKDKDKNKELQKPTK